MRLSDVLTTGEEVELSLKPDFLATFLPVFSIVCLVLLVNALFFVTSLGSSWMFKFALLLLSISMMGLLLAVAGAYLRYIYTFYFVTNKRIIYQSGIISRDHRDCRLDRVQNIYVGVSFLDRILNVGNIMFSTAGEVGIEVVFLRVKKPFTVKKQINEVIDRDVRHQTSPPRGV